jgi:hypothetical protein
VLEDGLAGGFAAVFVSPDRVFHVLNASLFVQRFDVMTLQPIGSQQRVLERVPTANAVAAFSPSMAGPIAYKPKIVQERQFTWHDRSGRHTGQQGPALSTEPREMRLWPDGSVTFSPWAPAGGRATTARSTLMDASGSTRGIANVCDMSPVRSPDARLIACAAYARFEGRSTWELFVQPITGGTSERLQPSTSGLKNPVDWSPDGMFVLYDYWDVDKTGDHDLLAQPLGGGDPIPVATTTAREQHGRFSPNGLWVAYERYEPGGRFEIYVQPFRGTSASKIKVSNDGGTAPEWSPNRSELYFVSLNDELMAVPIIWSADGTELKPGTPVRLFAIPPGSEYAPSPDGRFMVNMPIEEPPPIIVLSNWESRLR